MLMAKENKPTMRKIESQIIDAIKESKDLKVANSEANELSTQTSYIIIILAICNYNHIKIIFQENIMNASNDISINKFINV